MPQLGGFMGGIIIMTEKDLEKIKVMQQLPEKQIKWVMGSFGVHYILKTFRLIFN
jgi:hypothetical protein